MVVAGRWHLGDELFCTTQLPCSEQVLRSDKANLGFAFWTSAVLFEARSTHVWHPNPLPGPALSSEGVDLLDDPVIQRVARKYSKSPAQVRRGLPGLGGRARIPWEPGSGRRKGSRRLAGRTPARSSLGSLAPRAVLPPTQAASPPAWDSDVELWGPLRRPTSRMGQERALALSSLL